MTISINMIYFACKYRMLDLSIFEQIKLKLNNEFLVLENSLEHLSNLVNKIPISEKSKKAINSKNLKLKSAWYACLVNSNIDYLLIPEYLDSKQSRNILIKKETDEFYQSIDSFDLLKGKGNIDLFECILNKGEIKGSFDLFSSPVVETAKCPDGLKAIFSQFEKHQSNWSQLEKTLMIFYAWHQHNHYSFKDNRQLLLWLNFQLWKQFGNLVFHMNLEHYFFHHWNKESRDCLNTFKDFIHFIQQSITEIEKNFKEEFKNEIQFDQLKTAQKIANNYLFSISFNLEVPTQVLKNPLVKYFCQKGYLDSSDELKGDKKEALLELLEIGFIQIVMEEGAYSFIVNTSYNKQNHLLKYENVNVIKQEIDWETALKTEAKKVSISQTIREDKVKMNQPIKQKAYFG